MSRLEHSRLVGQQAVEEPEAASRPSASGSALATGPEAEELFPPGVAHTLSVPLVAVALAGLLLAANEEAVFRAVNGWPAVTGDYLWANLSVLGEGAAMLALGAGLAARRPRLLLAAALAALLATILLQGLKEVVAAPRPGAVLGFESIHVIGRTLSRRSFPSGHATTIFAAAALAFSLVRGAAGRAALLSLATLVVVSRLAVGAHWPLDVLAGAALGWLCGAAALHLAQRLRAPSPGLALALALLSLGAAVYVALPYRGSASYELARPVLGAVGLQLGALAARRAARRLRSG